MKLLPEPFTAVRHAYHAAAGHNRKSATHLAAFSGSLGPDCRR